MNSHFPRIMTLLRKERGLSQKSVAQSLGVSQALLSHYEKGIRECGLDFVVKAANFYGVSCDYLLGRTPQPSGATVQVSSVPESSAQEPMEQTLLLHSVSALYTVLEHCGSADLTSEASAYLYAAIYRLFRAMYTANPKNPQSMFAVRERLADGYAAASSETALANLCCLLSGEDIDGHKSTNKAAAPLLSPEHLTELCPELAASLLTLIRQAELRMGAPMAGEVAAKSQE